MNSEFFDFIKRNNIDIENLYEQLRIFKEDDINYLISNNKIEGPMMETKVSIADIIGYDYGWRDLTNNIARNFRCFFSNETPYQSRSIGMLDYSSDEVIEKLSPSFVSEPIKVLELDNERKIISTNGLHRYTVLRLHYLGELQKVKGDKTKEEMLRKKYEIPVMLTKVDLLKTYCGCLINMTSFDKIYVSNVYDENYHITGKVKIQENGKTIMLDDNELIKYTQSKIMSMSKGMKDYFLRTVQDYIGLYDSFKTFMETYFSKELALITEETTEKGRGAQ